MFAKQTIHKANSHIVKKLEKKSNLDSFLKKTTSRNYWYCYTCKVWGKVLKREKHNDGIAQKIKINIETS